MKNLQLLLQLMELMLTGMSKTLSLTSFKIYSMFFGVFFLIRNSKIVIDLNNKAQASKKIFFFKILL